MHIHIKLRDDVKSSYDGNSSCFGLGRFEFKVIPVYML